MPSVQLQRYLEARATGQTVEQACELSTIGRGEAELHERDIASGDLKLPRVHVHVCEDQSTGEEANMANDNSAGTGSVSSDQLRLFIERVERLEEEIKGLNSDKSDVFQEMKSDGFDTKTVKRILKLRKMEPHARQEAEALLETYMTALGMTPIEQAIALAA